MPNHVTNRFTFKGSQEDIKSLFETIKGQYEDGEVMAIDFRKIVPVPDNIFQGALGEKERRIYGKNNWYDWNCENWGTKWNAYSISKEAGEVGDDYIEFDTAWSAPHPIAQKLMEMFPNIVIVHEWADEDTGSNTGCVTYKNGEESGGYYENCSNDAYEVYTKLKGENMCLDKVDGEWIRYDCDTCPHKDEC